MSEIEVGTEKDPLTKIIAALQAENDEFKRRRDVLFVEDDEGIRELIGQLAWGFNCSVDYAADGETGLKMAQTKTYDLVMLDIALPGAFSGIDVFEHMRRNRTEGKPPVVFFTGRLDDEQGKRIDRIGFACFVKKPFAPNERFLTDFFGTFGIHRLPA